MESGATGLAAKGIARGRIGKLDVTTFIDTMKQQQELFKVCKPFGYNMILLCFLKKRDDPLNEIETPVGVNRRASRCGSILYAVCLL